MQNDFPNQPLQLETLINIEKIQQETLSFFDSNFSDPLDSAISSIDEQIKTLEESKEQNLELKTLEENHAKSKEEFDICGENFMLL
mgnify:CR=1 FL=1